MLIIDLTVVLLGTVEINILMDLHISRYFFFLY